MPSSFTWQTHPPEHLLQDRFHITTGFHPEQRTIIEQLIQGKRILAIQRTGWGKSLCYQMASLYYPHLTIVFSPLKALMRDQCQRCNDLYAIPSAIVSSEFTPEENCTTLSQAVEGHFKILFIAPERLDNADWQSYLPKMRISIIVIDEAHCISTWGHDFRPSYRRIVRLLSALPKNIPVLALTATANKRVEQDILQQIGASALVIRGTLYRSNLYLNVVELHGDADKLAYLAEVLPGSPGTGIIYTATRYNAEMLAAFLYGQGLQAEYYHAGRDEDVRHNIEHKLMANHYKVVCSTNALGMGIDKPDIRFVVHYHMPASPIHYYQEMGRAGRNGQIAWCILLYDPTDLAIQEHFIAHASPEKKYYEEVLSQVRMHPQGLHEREVMLLTGFAEKTVEIILADLEEQRFIKSSNKYGIYTATQRQDQIDISAHDAVRLLKQRELSDMQCYIQTDGCYMGYLTAYLGDQTYHCGTCSNCQATNFPHVTSSARIQGAAARFLEEEFLPRIERYGFEQQVIHEAGWSLSFHGTSRTGKLVHASKYEDAGPFPLSLVLRGVDLICTRYPVQSINGIVSVPPTKSGLLVETFARQVADRLDIEYLPVLMKVRPTQEQKNLTNWVQKMMNVKHAFAVRPSELIVGRTLLLIDDIYDSGVRRFGACEIAPQEQKGESKGTF